MLQSWDSYYHAAALEHQHGRDRSDRAREPAAGLGGVFTAWLAAMLGVSIGLVFLIHTFA